MKEMKYLLIIILALIALNLDGQNVYQRNLYDVNNRVKKMENRLRYSLLSNELLDEKLELVKFINRLSEESQRAGIKQEINMELGSLISQTCELAKMKLDLLESYAWYSKDSHYLIAFNDINKIYLAHLLKVKTKE